MAFSIDPSASKPTPLSRVKTNKKPYALFWAKGQPGYNQLLPYGPKVNVARKKQAEGRWVFAIEV